MTPEEILTDSEDLVGRRLGRYRISSSLGRGGMAEVFRANDDRLSREVAIKVVLPMYGSDAQLLQRFLREARVVASLEHPNILPIYDFGEHEGLPYLVLPLVRGGTLADRLEGRALEPARVGDWIRDLAQALDAAHAAGVLHRDVKPGNVLIGRDDHLFLADFGIARLCDATRLTRTGTVVGTPVYMAPEVAGGQPAEAASDLYSLAVMSYEMLAGRPPFDGENMLSILHQHATRPVPPITVDTDLPAGVDRVLEQGLSKQPAERPATCREFAELLAGQLPGAGVAKSLPASDQVPTVAMAREPTASPVGSAATSPATLSDAYATVRAPSGTWPQLRQWGLAGLLGGIVALAGFLTLRTFEPEPVVTAAAIDQSDVTATREPGAEIGGATTVEDPEPESLRPPTEADVEIPEPESSPASSTEPPSVVPPAPDPSSEPPPVMAQAPNPSSEPPVVVGHGPTARGSASRPGQTASEGGTGPPPGFERMRFNALRAFTSRTSERDFRKAQEAARRLPRRGPTAGQRAAMETFARGGLAYLDGDDSGAAAALHQALREPRFVTFWGPSPLMLLAASEPQRERFEAWELALGYGDPHATAGATLDSLLRHHPENARLRFARALVHRLDGEHGAVVRVAGPVFENLDRKDAPEARSYLAQILGEACLGLGRGEEALEWFERAFEAGGPFRGIVAMRGAEAARELKRPELVNEFLSSACEAGLEPACRRLQGNSRRPRERG